MSDDAYSRAVRLAKILQSDLEERLKKALADLGDPYLVRAHVAAARIKAEASLTRKGRAKGWTLEEALDKVGDFLGVRVVCNNLQDVERAAELIQAALEKDGSKVRRRDYIQSPLSSGYRAVHLLFRPEVKIGSESIILGCEVQLRTLLQDSWAHLAHDDIYKGSVSGPLAHKTRRLAETLARADRIAEQIRVRVARPRTGRRPAADAVLTRSSIAFLYHRAFNENPPEYVVESTLREFGSTPIRADGLDQVLHDADFLKRLQDAYTQSAPWGAGPEQLFRWAAHAVGDGKPSAVSMATREGRESWAEVDAQYKSELASSIPASMDELGHWFHDARDDGDSAYDVEQWADYFDEARDCEICGTKMVEIDGLAGKLVQHFGMRGRSADTAYEKVQRVLLGAGVEDADGGLICGHCRYVINKND